MSKSNSRDANKYHTIHDAPPAFDEVVLELKPMGRRRRIEIGFYDAQHNIWFLKDGYTEVHPRGWFHLPEQQ